MLRTSSSSSSLSSCASFSSFDDVSVKACSTLKFMCSYGGKILPRYPDGKLRYVGGETRVLAVDRSVSYSELQAKMGELCGWGTVSLRCQLPTEDLDALVSITSDEDLANLIEEYDLASRDRLVPLKIRAFLHPAPLPSSSSSKALKNKGKSTTTCSARPPPVPVVPTSSRFSGRFATSCYLGQTNPGHRQYLVHHCNHWQRPPVVSPF